MPDDSSARDDASGSADPSMTLTVAEALAKDAGRGVVRVDPDVLHALGLDVGDTVAVTGDRRAVARALPTHPDRRGQDIVQCDGVVRDNARASLGDSVTVAPCPVPPAERAVLRPTAGMPSDQDLDDLGQLVDGLPIQPGDRVRATLFGGRRIDLDVDATRPDGPAIIGPRTTLRVVEAEDDTDPDTRTRLAYEDVGGLGPQLQRIREMIELPLRRPGVFDRLGIDPPSGVLLAGPPGCGKTLLARTIAAEADASFYSVSGPEIIRKFYGESEAQLRSLFEQAEANAPSIVFIDEIDAIAPNREAVEGDVEKRVVATLLTLMDGLEARGRVVVIAATNRPNALDPALRRAGRFDREISISIPDREGRREILAIHSRGMPLADDVSLDRLADTTHGYVGADLEALCREAAMATLRRSLPDGATGFDDDVLASGARLEVRRADFQEAFREVQPSATREVFTEIPQVSWDDVGGLQEAKARLTEAVEWPMEQPDLFDRADVQPPRGVLLAGPPGCGKTLLAQALATETNANFISIKGPQLLSKYVGTSEERVRDVFKKARAAAPCIVFFDEIDAIAPTRAGADLDGGVASRVLTQVLTEMDGIEALEGVLVVGATNRLDRIDDALLRPGRFDEIVHIPPPDADARHEILRVHLRRKPLAGDVDPAAVVDATDGFSGAELAAVCRRAALDAIRRVVEEGEDLRITADDLTRAIQHVGDR